MSDLRERVAGILVDEFPAEIKRPSDAYRVADRILDAAGTDTLLDEAMGLLANRKQDSDPQWQEEYSLLCDKYEDVPSAGTEGPGLREAWSELRPWVVNLSDAMSRTDVKRDDGTPASTVIHDAIAAFDASLAARPVAAAPGEGVQEAAKAGYNLSCYAEAIKWTPGDNTREWLDELKRQIEHVQNLYTALAARPVEGERNGN